ncbi:metal ABC transporter solute-binding protein, Zn/Mn family [Marisediminicola senii]|uniref:metal ABC transporter solute-binding protein, Zn/Mn family n=1 Tax=Marisediminicola senii TaxID=2711233 RepID=UPI0013E9B9F1|nr:zinc ABC transporter substrate-binding protein [Marisediminicola senii]
MRLTRSPRVALSAGRRVAIVGGIAAIALTVTGCAPTGQDPDSTDAAAGSDLVQVVASTDVYGDIASRIGGDHVEVTSIISGAAQDPHSYEATARDQLALSNAQLVVENGGGYDPFIDTMLGASGSDDVVVVTATDASGLLDDDGHTEDEHAGDEHADDAAAEGDAAAVDDGHTEDDHADDEHAGEEHAADDHAGEEHAEDDGHGHVEGFNEHVWYSFSAVEAVAREIADQLAAIDADNADAYETQYGEFATELDALHERAHEFEAVAAGRGVAITEPVPSYLLADMGFENMTPDEFSEAIEEGTDVAPAVLQQTLALFSDDAVALLAYNSQTAGPETEQVRDAADEAGIAIVDLTETLPDGEDYLSWMSSNIDQIEAALG